jgi:hypothetical protein
MGFQWLTLNGCAVCMALEGLYDEEPSRPHPNCDCEIFEDSDEYEPGECWGNIDSEEWEVDTEPYLFRISIRVTLICPDGDTVHDYFDFEQTVDEFLEALEAPDGWVELNDEIHDGIHGVCAGVLADECSTFVDPTP